MLKPNTGQEKVLICSTGRVVPFLLKFYLNKHTVHLYRGNCYTFLGQELYQLYNCTTVVQDNLS